MSLFKDIILQVLTLQERFLMNSLKKTLRVKSSSKNRKIYRNGCLLSLDALAEGEKQQLEEEMLLILKSSNYDPLEVLDYIKKHDTKVFYIENEKFLDMICENAGFIYPQKGLKALVISFFVTKKLSFSTKEMFVLQKGTINKYYFIYYFYNWYAFKHGIAGLDLESQNLLKKFLFSSKEEDFSKLHLADIYKLKDAIKQDKYAIEFVLKLCQQFDSSKNALKKIKEGGASI